MTKKITKIKPFDLTKDNGKLIIKLLLPVTIYNGDIYDAELYRLNDYNTVKIIIDLSEIREFDSYLLLLLNSVKLICESKQISCDIINADIKLKLYIERKNSGISTRLNSDINSRKLRNYAEYLGASTILGIRDLINFIDYFGEVIIKSFRIFIKPREIRWKEFPEIFMRSGVNAVPIILLILFLIGIISGYQGALQLKQFGADIYIADLVGISIIRELGPLMSAIIVAGRSGSAFAAELGTMKVSDEIDALKSMGFDHIKFLVLPRVFAVTFSLPMLTFLANLAGLFGGMIAALSVLNITIFGYLNQLQRAVGFEDLASGLIKSLVFGFLIASVGCYRGLQVRGGADSVGKYTTISVVSGILLIILADVIFTFLFQSIGI